MKEATLKKLAMACSIIGIVMLLFVAKTASIPEKTISQMQETKNEQIIKIKGTIKNIQERENIITAELVQPMSQQITIFDDGIINFTNNSFVEVTGQVQVYKGKKSIVVDKIVKIT